MIPHKQLQDDLRGEFRGRLHVDRPHRHLYAADASPFSITPHAVAVPEDEDDLRVLVSYAYEHGLPLIPRGAGTGLSGESLGPGVVLDLSANFRSVLEVGADTVRAQCGVVLADLNAELAKHGRRFAPNPLSANTCTVGGVVGTNASGPNAFAHGYTREHTHALRVVWDNGETATLTPTRQASEAAATPQLRTLEIRTQTTAVLSQYADLITRCRPLTPFHRGGYLLTDVLAPAGLDLAKLLVGTEGTLAITTEAELRTVPLPGGVATTVLGFRTWNEALRAGLSLRAADGIVSCDVFDQRLLSLAQPHLSEAGIPPGVTGLLVAEFEADGAATATEFARAAVDRVRDAFSAAVLGEPSAAADQVTRATAVRAAVVGTSYSTGPSAARPVPFIEDTAVPGEELVRYVSGVSDLLRRAELAAVFHVHPLIGQVQVRPLLDLNRPPDRGAMWPLADQVFNLVIAVGGTISSRHGTGLARTPWVAKQAGELAPVFAELKRVFDPKGVLNPGKITQPDPSRPAWPLPELAKADDRQPLLVWTAEQRETAGGRCNGCGDCRVRTPPVRMCPTFHATGDEAATPRAKAALLRLLTGANREEAVAADEVRAVADTCVNCKMCRSECPSRVDIPKLAAEAKAELHAANGLNRDEWVQARVTRLLRVAGLFPGTANTLLGHRPSRWLIEKLLGLSRHRRLPKVVRRPFLRRAERAGWTKRGTEPPGDGPTSALRVAYFADTYTNFADPLIGEAAVAVLRHHGIEVYVPPRQRGCGVAAFTQGDLDTARETAARNVGVLADLIRDGFVVVCSDPTAAVTITQDYPGLLDGEDVALVAAHTQELTAFLWNLYRSGWLRTDFPKAVDWSLGHHVPCHLKALGESPAGPDLLRLIPGVRVDVIDESCSGMAGTHGLKATAYAASLRAGKPMLDRLTAPAIRFGSTECGTCRMQMQEGSGKRTLHPIQYLAAAYGLLPQIGRKLSKPLGRLVTD